MVTGHRIQSKAYSKRKKCGYKILTFNGQTIILLFKEEVRLSSLIKIWLQRYIDDTASMPTTDDRYIRH